MDAIKVIAGLITLSWYAFWALFWFAGDPDMYDAVFHFLMK